MESSWDSHEYRESNCGGAKVRGPSRYIVSSFKINPMFRASGSMEPAFYRGDLLFLMNPRNTPYVVGDITVYKVPGADIPIVHRVIETHTV
jgi:signal peptidase I